MHSRVVNSQQRPYKVDKVICQLTADKVPYLPNMAFVMNLWIRYNFVEICTARVSQKNQKLKFQKVIPWDFRYG